MQQGNRKQGIKHTLNKDKRRNQHPDLQLIQTQIPRHQSKTTTNNSQGNTFELEPIYPATAGLEYSKIADALKRLYKQLCEDVRGP